jgi:hypothetical protein
VTPNCETSYMTSNRSQILSAGRLRFEMKDAQRALYLVGPFNLVVLLAGVMVGCGASVDNEAVARAVYIDLATKRVVVADATKEYPAVHPVTGDPTLMPAMHCPKCGQWRQVPLPAQVNQMNQALQCFKCKTELSPNGPFPPEALADADRNQDYAP